MAEVRFEVRVPAAEHRHHAAWKAAATAAGQSLSAWTIAACNRALAPAAPPPVVTAPPADAPVLAAPFPADPWWEAGLWAGRVERAFDADAPDAIDWRALRAWAMTQPDAAARLDAWAARQYWGPRWAAAFHNR